MRSPWLVLTLVVGCAGSSPPVARDGGLAVPKATGDAGGSARQAAREPPGQASAPKGKAASTSGSQPSSAPGSQRTRCNTPALTERFARCRAARGADACRAAGGAWGRQGTASEPSCACPTGQGGCPCVREGDCLAGCRAPMALNASRANRCRAMWSSCAPMWPSLGCWCWFGTDGQPVERCAP